MRNLKLGFKMYSDELGKYDNEVLGILEKNLFSYIELFVNPNTLECLKGWKEFKDKINIPFTLHAPHSIYNVNLADKNQEEFNKKILNEQIDIYTETIDAQYVIVHPGKGFNIEETVRQLKIIKPKRMVIENKPLISKKTMQPTYRGATVEEIKFVKDNYGCEFCLDISHCMSTANALNKNPYEYLKEFQKLNPHCYHISGNKFDSLTDRHLHFSECDWDLDRIFNIVDITKNITVETRKDNETCFEEYKTDFEILKGIKNLVTHG